MNRKIIILAISIVLALTMSCSSAFATSSSGTFKITVTQDYSKAQKVVNEVNRVRKKKGLSTVKLDKSLTNTAILRAADTFYLPCMSEGIDITGGYMYILFESSSQKYRGTAESVQDEIWVISTSEVQ